MCKETKVLCKPQDEDASGLQGFTFSFRSISHNDDCQDDGLANYHSSEKNNFNKLKEENIIKKEERFWNQKGRIIYLGEYFVDTVGTIGWSKPLTIIPRLDDGVKMLQRLSFHHNHRQYSRGNRGRSQAPGSALHLSRHPHHSHFLARNGGKMKLKMRDGGLAGGTGWWTLSKTVAETVWSHPRYIHLTGGWG